MSFYPPRLTIELVPRTCWFDNVRSAVSSTDWKRLRQQTPEQQGGNARFAVERDPDGLWSAMKSGITMMTGSVRPSPGSSHYDLHAMKSNTWGSASSGVKRTKRWLIWRSSTAGPYRAHLTMWMKPLTCGGNDLIMPGSWISPGSGRRGFSSRVRQQQRRQHPC